MPRISVIMSTYNDGKYLRETIDSVLNQTYQDFEFIIVDDASTDETQAILSTYKDPRLITLRNAQNMERSYSRNRALQMSTGEYIAILDADDICLPNRLAIQFDYFTQYPLVDVLGSAAVLVDNQGRKTGKIWRHAEDHNSIAWANITTVPIIHPSAMIRRNILFEAGGYDDYYPCEDAELWCRLLRNGAHFANIQEPLIKYRASHEQNIRQKTSLLLAKEIKRKFLEDLTGKAFIEADYNLILLSHGYNPNALIPSEKAYEAIELLKIIFVSFQNKGLFIGDLSLDIYDSYLRSITGILSNIQNRQEILLQAFLNGIRSSQLSRYYWLSKDIPFSLRWLCFFIASPKQAVKIVKNILREKSEISSIR